MPASSCDATTEADNQPSIGPIHQWILQHDDSWLFTISYVGLALVLSIWISLFWLVAVVGVHFLLEWIRQKAVAPSGSNIAIHAAWEIKLDLALILFALALTAYMDLLLGIAGLGGAARVGAKGAARVGGWGRAIKATLLSLDDAAQVSRMVIGRSSSDASTKCPELYEGGRGDSKQKSQSGSSVHGPSRLSKSDFLTIGFGAICFSAIVAAPWLTDHSISSLFALFLVELHPFP